MKKPRYPNRYIVFHSAIGELPFNTLKDARNYVKRVEWQCPQYALSIYDSKNECYIF
ncbi:hypothetical protein [Methanobrevibacter sp.]|uniref:hypothetical protein n=1 Tax=Methanobrevibacter sp. TaxID=66852 RepID=UPI00388E2A8C